MAIGDSGEQGESLKNSEHKNFENYTRRALETELRLVCWTDISLSFMTCLGILGIETK